MFYSTANQRAWKIHRMTNVMSVLFTRARWLASVEISWRTYYREIRRKYARKKREGAQRQHVVPSRAFFDFAEVLEFRRACNWMQSSAGIDTPVVLLAYRAVASPRCIMLTKRMREAKWFGGRFTPYIKISFLVSFTKNLRAEFKVVC